jgi:eukaryotic-like serine/threonine-protein kinase
VPDPSDSAVVLMDSSARRAVALDSTLADAQIALALAQEFRLRFAEALAHYRRALTLEPANVSAHHIGGMFLLNAGHTGEAIRMLQRATHLDPLAKSAASAYAVALSYARRFPEAQAESRRVLAIDSTFPLAILTLGLAQTYGGQPDSAVLTLERGLRLHPNAPGQNSALVFAYAAAGRWSDAERLRAQLRRPGSDPSGGADAAFAELVLGDPEPLVRLLTTEAGQRRWIQANVGFGCNPLLDPLWMDARFRTAMRRLEVEPCPLAQVGPDLSRPGT